LDSRPIAYSRHDPRLRQLVALAGDPALFNDMDVPYFTRRNWASGRRVKKLNADQLLERSKAELIIRVLKLNAKCTAMAAKNQLLMAKIEVFGINTDWKRIPESGKNRLLAAIASARNVNSLKECLGTIKISGARFHNWMRRQKKCRLQDHTTCPKSSPTKLTPKETETIRSLFFSKEYSHYSIRALALYALIMGYVACSSSTWYRQINQNKWRRPRIRVYPKEKKVGIRKEAPNELYPVP